MDALGNIEIRIEGSVGARKLKPELVDIDEIREVLEQVSGLLFPTEKRAQRPRISYQIVEGSVRHKFRTLMQTDYSDAYLDRLMEKAAPAWEVAPPVNEWLDEIRGGAHA